MDSLRQCNYCFIIFSNSLDDEMFGVVIHMCPGCGESVHEADEYPRQCEITAFWDTIGSSFTVRERTTLKLTADRAMRLPD